LVQRCTAGGNDGVSAPGCPGAHKAESGEKHSLDFRDWVRGPTGRPLVNSTSSPLSFLAAKSLVKFFYTKIFIEGMSTR
jgi:hypothetical protein